MRETASDNSTPAIYAQSWAVRFAFALLAAFTLILGLAFFDNAHRKQLETVSETTAVGDGRFFAPPAEGTSLPVVGASLDGQPLYVGNLKPVEVRDTHTHRAGQDAERGLGIYELSAAATAPERKIVGSDRRTFLLKTGVNEFVIARPAK
jgi:hypothetical protein